MHRPLPFFEIPDFISSTPPSGSNDMAIDLVFVDFIGSKVLDALNGLQTKQRYSRGDIQPYTGILLKEVFGGFAQAKWE